MSDTFNLSKHLIDREEELETNHQLRNQLMSDLVQEVKEFVARLHQVHLNNVDVEIEVQQRY